MDDDEDYQALVNPQNPNYQMSFPTFALRVARTYLRHQYPRTYRFIKFAGKSAISTGATYAMYEGQQYVRKTLKDENKKSTSSKMPKTGLRLTDVPSRNTTRTTKKANVVILDATPSKYNRRPKQLFVKERVVKKPLKKQVKDLQKRVSADQAYHTYRWATSFDLQASSGQIAQTHQNAVTTTVQEASMANLRYYNPSVPGTLTTADASTGTYSRQIHFSSISSRLELRNNYQVPCKVRVYLMTPKQDTSITPTTYYSNGLTDQMGTADTTSPLIYPTDVDMLSKAYQIDLVRNKILEPGKQISVSHTVKNIDYNPALVDTHNLTFQKKYKNFLWFVRIEGVLHHDTVQDEQGLGQCGIDGQTLTTYKIIYDAGANLNDISLDENRTTTFTTSGVCSNKPVSDNQAYSKS